MTHYVDDSRGRIKNTMAHYHVWAALGKRMPYVSPQNVVTKYVTHENMSVAHVNNDTTPEEEDTKWKKFLEWIAIEDRGTAIEHDIEWFELLGDPCICCRPKYLLSPTFGMICCPAGLAVTKDAILLKDKFVKQSMEEMKMKAHAAMAVWRVEKCIISFFSETPLIGHGSKCRVVTWDDVYWQSVIQRLIRDFVPLVESHVEPRNITWAGGVMKFLD